MLGKTVVFVAYHRFYDNWQLDHDVIIERMGTRYGMYEISHLNELAPRIYRKQWKVYLQKYELFCTWYMCNVEQRCQLNWWHCYHVLMNNIDCVVKTCTLNNCHLLPPIVVYVGKPLAPSKFCILMNLYFLLCHLPNNIPNKILKNVV